MATKNNEYPPARCYLCPRECGIDRSRAKGFCGEKNTVRIAAAQPHMWEEPCISGINGAGTVFFSGCVLKCVYCQNYEISQLAKGFEVSINRLAEIFLLLQQKGVHNIDLVNPTHFVPQIISALDIAGDSLKIPVVYNSGGYEKPQTLDMLKGRVSIFLPDVKYFDSELSKKYSRAADYFEKTIAAVEKMVSLVGKPVIKDGIMQSGVIVRHLLLPNHRHDSIRVIEELKKRFAPDEIMVSLMRQYTPMFRAADFAELNRRVSTFEYSSVYEALEKAGFDGYVQQKDSADEQFLPKFHSEDNL